MADEAGIPPFDVHGEATTQSQRWKRWLSRLEMFLVAAGIKEDGRKMATLLHQAGEEAFSVYETLAIEEKDRNFDSVKEALTKYFVPGKNMQFCIYTFRVSRQEATESLDKYQMRLRQLAVGCEFHDDDREIKSQLILGTNMNRLRRQGLRDDTLTLKQLLDLGRGYEASEYQAKQMEGGEKEMTGDVNWVRAPTEARKRANSNAETRRNEPTVTAAQSGSGGLRNFSNRMCFNCGRAWPHAPPQECPARSVTCRGCGKVGHFVRFCRGKRSDGGGADKKTNIVGHICNEESDDEELFVIGMCAERKRGRSKMPEVRLTIGEESKCTRFIVDSGTSVNILGREDYRAMQRKPTLVESRAKLLTYGSDEPLPLLGRTELTLHYEGQQTCIIAYVVDRPGASLLNYGTAKQMGIVKMVNNVERSTIEEEIKRQYPKLFRGVGKLIDYQIYLHVDEEVAPVAQRYRPLPFRLRKKVENELERLLRMDVIERIDEGMGPTPWVSPIHCVDKPKDPDPNAIHMCVDAREVNKAIKRVRHTSPRLEDVVALAEGARYFSKLDLNHGFNQVELDEESRKYTVFATHVGLFRFKRLLFGINSASELFQDTIRQVIEGLSNCINIVDDIFIVGKTVEAHDAAIHAVLRRLEERGLTLNEDKCEVRRDEIVFFGHVFSAAGVAIDPRRVEAIEKIGIPKSVTEVKSLLGMVVYCARFIENMAETLKPLRDLTKRSNGRFQWEEKHQKAWTSIKKQLGNKNILAYHDPAAVTHVTVDAGPNGLGAILAQVRSGEIEPRVVAYASRALTDVESRYSQIERETLAAVWAIEHFYLYLYGVNFLLFTDHKPLISIFGNRKARPSARIERLCLRIQQYVFEVKFTKGSSNPSDYMLRHAGSEGESDGVMSRTLENYINFVVRTRVPKSLTRARIAECTQEDASLKMLQRALRQDDGESEKLWKDDCLKSFRMLRDEFTIAKDGIILRGDRIVVPTSLRDEVVKIAHRGHQGVVKTKMLLRQKVWYPGLDTQVEKLVAGCIPCQASVPVKVRTPLEMSDLPDRPWQKIAVDFLGPFPDGKILLVVVDEYLQFPFVDGVSSTGARNVVAILRKRFSELGVPEVVKSDNGPPFSSNEFADFLGEMGVRHHWVTPLWPEANGEVERLMKTLNKANLTAVTEERKWYEEIYEFLMNYRATPHTTTGVPPADALYGRPIKTRLSQQFAKLDDEVMRQRDKNKKAEMKRLADGRRHTRGHELMVGDVVLLKRRKINKLTTPYDPDPFVVTSVAGSQVMADRRGQSVIRNSSFFKKMRSKEEVRLERHGEDEEEDERVCDDSTFG